MCIYMQLNFYFQSFYEPHACAPLGTHRVAAPLQATGCAATYHEARWARRTLLASRRWAPRRRQTGDAQSWQLRCSSSQHSDQLQAVTQPCALPNEPSSDCRVDNGNVVRVAPNSHVSRASSASDTRPSSTAIDELADILQRVTHGLVARPDAHTHRVPPQAAFACAAATTRPLHQRPDPGTSPLALDTHVVADVGMCRQFALDWREAARRCSVEPPPAELERPCVQSDVLQTQTATPSRPDRLSSVPPPWNDKPQRMEVMMLRQQTRDEVLNFVSHGHLRSSRFENLSSSERKRLSAWLLSMFGQAVSLHADTCARFLAASI